MHGCVYAGLYIRFKLAYTLVWSLLRCSASFAAFWDEMSLNMSMQCARTHTHTHARTHTCTTALFLFHMCLPLQRWSKHWNSKKCVHRAASSQLEGRWKGDLKQVTTLKRLQTLLVLLSTMCEYGFLISTVLKVSACDFCFDVPRWWWITGFAHGLLSLGVCYTCMNTFPSVFA